MYWRLKGKDKKACIRLCCPKWYESSTNVYTKPCCLKPSSKSSSTQMFIQSHVVWNHHENILPCNHTRHMCPQVLSILVSSGLKSFSLPRWLQKRKKEHQQQKLHNFMHTQKHEHFSKGTMLQDPYSISLFKTDSPKQPLVSSCVSLLY